MKKVLALMVISLFLAIPLGANAGIIGNVNLEEIPSDPTGDAHFPSGGTHTWYIDYDVKLNGAGPFEAFCVEDAGGSLSGTYTLLTIDSSTLASVGLSSVANRYLAAATVAEYYWNNKYLTDGTEDWKAGAQLAVWELIVDGPDAFDLSSSGSTTFYALAGNPYVDEANAIWNAVRNNVLTSTSEWILAVNPTVAAGGTVSLGPNQNYMVRYHVPEPGTLLLLGAGLLGLAGLGRKRSRK